MTDFGLIQLCGLTLLVSPLFCPRYCHALVLGIRSPNKYYCHALVLGRAKNRVQRQSTDDRVQSTG